MRASSVMSIFQRLLLVASMLSGAGMAFAAGTPETVVADLHQALISIMKDGEQLGFSGRRDKIAPVIDRSFDFDSIARVAMGRYWRKMTQEQQIRSRQLMRALTIGNYADSFSSYSGESFEFVGRQEGRRGQQLVRTELVVADDAPVQLDYVLKQQAGRWWIINVLANGVSDLSLKRAQYGSIISKQGIVALLQQIDAQITRLYPKQ